TAVMETGLSITVPLFLNIGDKVRIDTRTGTYVERIKE
ncbi:MAG: elongation factor P, partial [Candidatus Marinimicrobia bacterium]|nr:elongation factor P [Candidatus Neomarinimicrobiota bacterium]